MFEFLAVGGYYSSPTKDLGEKGIFNSIIKNISSFITTNWIFFLILLLIILIIIYFIYCRLRKNKENLSPNSSGSVPNAF